jgi:hypothetical protein
MDALHICTREDFRFCDLLCNFKVSANLFQKNRYNRRRTSWMFSQKMLRGSLERRLIFDEEKGFFEKKTRRPSNLVFAPSELTRIYLKFPLIGYLD